MAILRRALKFSAIAAAVLIVFVLVALAATQTAWFRDWLRTVVVRESASYLNGQLEIGQLRGNLFGGIELHQVAIRQNGRLVVGADSISAKYNLGSLLSEGIVIDEIVLTRPVVVARREGDGWNLARLAKEQASEEGQEGPGRAIAIRRLVVDNGRVQVQNTDLPIQEIDALQARLAFAYEPVKFDLAIERFGFEARPANVTLRDLTGRIALEGDDLHVSDLAVTTGQSELTLEGVVGNYASGTPTVNATLNAPRITPAEFAAIVPALGSVEVAPSVHLRAQGPLDALRVTMGTESAAGNVSAELTADVTAPSRAVDGTIEAQRLDLAPLLGDESQRSRITGTVTLDVRVPGTAIEDARGTFAVDAGEVVAAGYAASDVNVSGTIRDGHVRFEGRARAYGAAATAAGTLVVPVGGQALSYDVTGDLAGVDLRRLPRTLGAPRAESRIAGHYAIRGGPSVVEANVRLRPSSLAGTQIVEGTVARVTMRGRQLAYAVDGGVTGLDLQQLGRAFGVAALSDDRFRSAVNGTFDVSGSGRALADLDVSARAQLTDSTLSAVRIPVLTLDAVVANRTLRAHVVTDFARLDPGALGVARLEGSDVNGAADLTVRIADVTAPITLAHIDASGTLTLAPSRVAEVVIDSAAFTGGMANQVVTIERFDLKGPAVGASAAGTVALDGTTASNLVYRLAATDLESIGKVVGQDLGGVVTVEGTVSGTTADLATTGSLGGNRLRYGGNVEALTLNSDFTVRVPDLDPARASVEAKTTGAFIRAAGTDIEQLRADTKYAGEQLEFDADVQAGPRNLSAGGRVLIHADHQELHLAGFSLGTQDMTWSLPAGTEAVVRYGGERLAIRDLVLERGEQRIAAEGDIPLGEAPTESSTPTRLQLRVEHLQLADIDRLMLGEGRVGGELNATADVAGTLANPDATAKFAITNGNVRGTPFLALEGDVTVRDQRIGLDVRLDQSPGQSLTARGELPMALVRDGAAGGARDAPAAADQEIDVRVETTPFDLALVQGLTTALEDVKGTLQANVHVTGDVADPHLDGFVNVTGGAFTLAASGAQYTGFEAQVRLEPDRVLVEQVRLVDDDGDPLTVQGALAVHNRALGDVDLRVEGTRFEVLDNPMGDVDANIDLRITGGLASPRVEGELAVHSGRLEADRILAQATSDGAYALEPQREDTLTDAQIARMEQGVAGGAGQSTPEAVGGASASAGDVPEAVGTSGPAARGDGRAANANGAAEGSTMDRLAMDIRVTVPDDLVVRGNDLRTASSPIALGNLNMTLGGDVRLEKGADEAGGPTITGSIGVVRGFYEFQGRRFEVQRGSEVRFQGLRPINPMLQIDAQREIAGVITQVHLRGSVQRPELRLSSDPPLDQSDILSLIVFNAPVNSLGSAERTSLSERAGALAAGFVADPLTRSLGRALDLDYFEIRASGVRGEPSLAVGEQIGDRLYVRFSQQFGSDEASRLMFEYRLADFLRLVTSVAEGGRTTRPTTRRVESQAVDLIFHWSY